MPAALRIDVESAARVAVARDGSAATISSTASSIDHVAFAWARDAAIEPEHDASIGDGEPRAGMGEDSCCTGMAW